MTFMDNVIILSKEGRAWATLLMPVISSFVAGWHLPQPSWTKTRVRDTQDR